jgi:hypothetical protein
MIRIEVEDVDGSCDDQEAAVRAILAKAGLQVRSVLAGVHDDGTVF